jgi:hypothetical protein
LDYQQQHGIKLGIDLQSNELYYDSNISAGYQKINSNVYYLDTSFTDSFKPEPNLTGIYIDINGCTKYWDGYEWTEQSYEIVHTFNEINHDTVPTTKAVVDLLNENNYAQKSYVDDTANAALLSATTYTDEQIVKSLTSGTVDLTGYATKTDIKTVEDKIPSVLSQLENNMGFITANDIPEIPSISRISDGTICS